MSLELILIFSLTVFVTSIIPGPSMLLALTHGMQYGAKKTIISALGNVTATFIQALISVVGLGALLVASETAFEVIKWFGAGYLFYMGVGMLRASRESHTNKLDNKKAGPFSPLRMFMQSFIVTAGNPKAIIFFGAVFPQFIDSTMPIVPQAAILVSICGLSAFCCYMIYGMGGEKASFIFSSSSVGKYIKRVIGSTFIGSGVALALSAKS
ncbi:MAG: LysE family translocator [Aliivibrio sp.]|uniref:LysE family translocator n=1 Tax=Aliivibrio sp. TaxID=1872443 RepID=UPI001A61A4F6|nr:LysE family translocator [Aliivibrio sp.]